MLVTAPEVLGRLTGLGHCLLFWVRCVLPCAAAAQAFGMEAPGIHNSDCSAKQRSEYPDLCVLLEAFSVALSLADRNIFRSTSCVFSVLRAALWWLQPCPEHWG